MKKRIVIMRMLSGSVPTAPDSQKQGFLFFKPAGQNRVVEMMHKSSIFGGDL